MEEYVSNSKKSKEQPREEKKVGKVVSGKVTTKKRGAGSKLADVFISDDASNVKSYIIMDVLIPAAKKAISDIITNGTDMILYGETGRSRKSGSSRISYSRYYESDRDRRAPIRSTRYSFDDVILETRAEAEDVLFNMEELLKEYSIVSVADFYDLVGIEGNYTDNRYGWTDLHSASVLRDRDGYRIKLPRVMALD